MKLPEMPFTRINWQDLTPQVFPGETGQSQWRTAEQAGLRTRIVEYGPGFVADHWCDRGHVLFVVSGEIEIELADGRIFALTAGAGFTVSDHGDAAHLVRSTHGARVFIVD
ncbi:MAG: DHCW motif cupin fold protein [Pseudodonghicola sp.]|nr:DHCW motif cupin fold protein [Pseudodonghicola sp.]